MEHKFEGQNQHVNAEGKTIGQKCRANYRASARANDKGKNCKLLFSLMMMPMLLLGCAPFTTAPFATGPFTTRLVVKGSVIIIIIIIMIVIIVFGICIQFFLSISWSGVIMMVVYEEVDSETDMVAD